MAKANLTLTNGTTVQIEGSSEEVASLLAIYSETHKSGRGTRKIKKGIGKMPKKARNKGPVGYITELADEGFFKNKKSLSEIQKKLEEAGHIYAQTSLSPALLNLTKKKILRRLREKKGWLYVKA